MHYNYYSDIVWAIDWALVFIIILTSAVILLYAAAKDRRWNRRRDGLLGIKKDLYEMVLSGKDPSYPACQLFISSVTPQQFMDIVTNRNKTAVFFNAAEQGFLKNCFAIPKQIERLERTAKFSLNKWRRIEAILCLGYIGKKETIGIIKKALSGRDSDIIYFAIISLGQIRTKESARALLKYLRKNRSNSYKIISILEGFPAEITDDIFELVRDRDPDVCQKAATLLSKFDTSPYIKELKDLVRDDSAGIRAAGCDCLASCRICKEETTGILKACLKDDNWLVRRHAVLALEKVMGNKAIEEVIDMINDVSWLVVDAVRDVMIAHVERAVPYMEKFLKGSYDIAKKYSLSALEESGYLAKLLKNTASDIDKDRALHLVELIVKAGYLSSIESAVSTLEPATRSKIAGILAGIKQA